MESWLEANFIEETWGKIQTKVGINFIEFQLYFSYFLQDEPFSSNKQKTKNGTLLL